MMNHAPVPVTLLRGMVSLALLWDWKVEALALLLMFAGMLRPIDFFRLRVMDLLTPEFLRIGAHILYLRIVQPKMKRLTARREFVRIDDSIIVDYAMALSAHRPGHEMLWMSSPYDFRCRHDALVTFFGLLPHDGVGVTPASHRGGGPTCYFAASEDPEWVRWRGRWQSK